MGSFRPEEVGDEGSDFGVGLAGEIVEPLELVGINVFLVECDVEFALDFGAGTLGIPQELDELFVATAIKTFGNVVHEGTGGPLDLVFESEVPGQLAFFGDAVNQMRQFPAHLPRLDVFEAFYFKGYFLVPGSWFRVPGALWMIDGESIELTDTSRSISGLSPMPLSNNVLCNNGDFAKCW